MQSGFRAGHGCISATLKVLNDIITNIDKRHYCAAVFIDLAKAFDSITTLLLADSTAVDSQMIASPSPPTTSLIEFRMSNRRACCPNLWQSLWGYNMVQFSDRLSSLYTLMMSLLLLVILWSTSTQMTPFYKMKQEQWKTICDNKWRELKDRNDDGV
jgi:hypothetical protein